MTGYFKWNMTLPVWPSLFTGEFIERVIFPNSLYTTFHINNRIYHDPLHSLFMEMICQHILPSIITGLHISQYATIFGGSSSKIFWDSNNSNPFISFMKKRVGKDNSTTQASIQRLNRNSDEHLQDHFIYERVCPSFPVKRAWQTYQSEIQILIVI